MSRISAERLALALRRMIRRWNDGELTSDELYQDVLELFRDRVLRDAYATAIERSRTHQVVAKIPIGKLRPDGKPSAFKVVQEPMDILKLPDFKANLIKDMYADVTARLENHPDLLSILRFMLAGKEEPEKEQRETIGQMRLRGLFGGKKE